VASIFSKIIKGEIPSHKIGETKNCVAFLDVFPLAKGHTLIVPKKEIDYIFDLDDDLLTELNLFSKKIAKALKKTINCKRIGTAVIGLEVPHAHLHLIPINSVEDINFSRPKLKISQEEMEHIAKEIKSNL